MIETLRQLHRKFAEIAKSELERPFEPPPNITGGEGGASGSGPPKCLASTMMRL
jgi:hypothetical protein